MSGTALPNSDSIKFSLSKAVANLQKEGKPVEAITQKAPDKAQRMSQEAN
jgi:hypothetical protein